jgi:hypothetical protein
LVDPEPEAKSDDVVAVASYPKAVVDAYVAPIVDPVPPDTVARIPNCSEPTVDDAAVVPMAEIVLSGFCCDVSVCPRTVIAYP